MSTTDKLSPRGQTTLTLEDGSKLKVMEVFATEPFTFNGRACDVLKASPGKTVGCALSLSIVASGQKLMGSKVLLSHVAQGRAHLVLDKQMGGLPVAVKYKHRYGKFTDMNDRGVAKDNPELFDRPFILTPPKIRKVRSDAGKMKVKLKGKRAKQRRAMGAGVARGARYRAEKAGLVAKKQKASRSSTDNRVTA